MPPRVLESWVQQQTYFNDSSLTAPPASGTINAAITDGSGISRTLTVSGANLKVEHAEVTVNLTHANAGDLILKLPPHRHGIDPDEPAGEDAGK